MARPHQAVDLRGFLLGQDHEWLADELLRAAQNDPATAARLRSAAGVPRDVAADLERVRAALRAAIELDRVVGWRGVASHSKGVNEALDGVRELLDDGHPEPAMAAAEDAMRLLEESYECVDDSGGTVVDLVERARGIHLAACRLARPDPVELGERLARWALQSELDLFLDSASTYAEVLGPEGLASFERVVDQGWQKLPRLLPGDDSGQGGRRQLAQLKESLASLRGVDAVVDVIARDLSSPQQFHRVASTLADAGRIEEAIGWLDRARDAFAKPTDARLTELAADLHHRAGRPGAATALAWNGFMADPSLKTYLRLSGFAQAAGTWPQRRQAAIKVLTSLPTAVKTARSASSNVEPRGHSTLVEILLAEGDIDGAWTAAGKGGCTRGLWLRLAHARARTHPEDAVPILQTEIMHTIDGGQRPAYLAAAALAQELRRYARACGRSVEFDEWILRLRETHRRRRAMLDEFDRAGLP